MALGYACDHTRDVVLLCAPEAGGGGRAVGRSCTGHPRRPAVTGTLPGLETLRAPENLVLLDQLGRYRGWQRTRRIARARDELLSDTQILPHPRPKGALGVVSHQQAKSRPNYVSRESSPGRQLTLESKPRSCYGG